MYASPTVEQPAFLRKQYEFAAHIRDPRVNPIPPDVEDRRMAIYRELFYNNVEGFLADNFPVLRQVLPNAHWHAMARDFLAHHRCRTPLFPEIGQEFIQYLQNERGDVTEDPRYMLELAHYEWVELALEFSDADPTAQPVDPNGDPFSSVPIFSPLMWVLTYQYPVHRIGPDFQPEALPDQPTHLLVYRNRRDAVEFLELNAVTQRLIQLLKENPDWSGQEAMVQIGVELNHPQPDLVIEAGRQLLQDLRSRDVITGTRV